MRSRSAGSGAAGRAGAGRVGLLAGHGLVSPLIFMPALAPRMAAALAGERVPELDPFAPARLVEAAG